MKGYWTTKLLAVCLAFAGPTIAANHVFYVAGPVDPVQGDSSQLSVLGQTVSIVANTKFYAESRRISAKSFAEAAVPGVYVYAETEDNAGKLEAKSFLIIDAPYVAGASVVFVAGIVDAYSGLNGQVRLGALLVDVSSVSPEVLSRLSKGDLVQFSGTQPSLLLPLVLSSDLNIYFDRRTSTSGSDVESLGISGSGIASQGISGSGKSAQGISGSGTQGISGSGTLGISGSGIASQGISGSGAA